jgi:hypothetical protein
MFLLPSLWLRHIKRCATAEVWRARQRRIAGPGNLENRLRQFGDRVGNVRLRGVDQEESRELARLAFAQHAPDHETDIGGPLAKTPHEVREPFTTEWNIDADAEAVARERRLQIAPDAVQHLELVAIR